MKITKVLALDQGKWTCEVKSEQLGLTWTTAAILLEGG